MNIKDKINISKNRFCPPHRWPHKFPFFGKKICDEPCHVHSKRWRSAHHCFFVNCSNALIISS